MEYHFKASCVFQQLLPLPDLKGAGGRASPTQRLFLDNFDRGKILEREFG